MKSIKEFMVSRSAAMALSLIAVAACTNVLDVPPPKAIRTAEELETRSGAEATYYSAKQSLISALAKRGGLIEMTGLFADEFENAHKLSQGGMPQVDARATTTHPEDYEPNVYPLYDLMQARIGLLLAIPRLMEHEPAGGQWLVGDAYAMLGWMYMVMAETYCSGMTMDNLLPGGGWERGHPLSVDSLYVLAEANFQLAVDHADTSTATKNLGNSGLVRVRLDRGNFSGAATAAQSIPTNFEFSLNMNQQSYNSWSFYYEYIRSQYSCAETNMAENEGGVGLNYRSANDPRLAYDSLGRAYDICQDFFNTPRYYFPTKFGRPTPHIPIATGVAARLAEAEADLHANGTNWLTILNDLRATAISPAMPALSDPGSPDARVDLLFRERAFWQFGTGTRMTELRRLVREYSRPVNTVFPSGNYLQGQYTNYPTYGNDLSFSLPITQVYTINNPYYKGCSEPTSTP